MSESSAGERLRAELTAALPRGAGFTASELVVLDAIAGCADTIEMLEAALRVDGAIVTGSQGQRRLSGAATELRLQRTALARLVRQLGIDELPVRRRPGGAEPMPLTGRSGQAQRAAQKRWANHERRERKHA